MAKLLDILIEKYEGYTTELGDINQRAADDDGRELTEEEQKRSDELDPAIAATAKRIDHVRKQEEQIAKTHERSKLPARKDEDPTASKDHPVQVRSEPKVYGEGSQHEFLRDLLVYKAGGLGLDVMPSAEVQDRMARHITECKTDHTHRRAVNSGNLAGIVNPMFDPATIARGLYDGAVTKQLMRQYPLPAEGDSITVPRVTTTASKANPVQENEGDNFAESALVTTAVKFEVFTVALRMPVSIQAIERGTMSMELMQDEIVMAWMESCNHMALYGDNTDNEPKGILWQNAANPVPYVEYDLGAPTVVGLLDKITDTESDIGEARKRSPDAIITGVGTWGRIRRGRDDNGRRLLSPDERTGRNVDGMGRVVAEDTTVARSSAFSTTSTCSPTRPSPASSPTPAPSPTPARRLGSSSCTARRCCGWTTDPARSPTSRPSPHQARSCSSSAATRRSTQAGIRPLPGSSTAPAPSWPDLI